MLNFATSGVLHCHANRSGGQTQFHWSRAIGFKLCSVLSWQLLEPARNTAQPPSGRRRLPPQGCNTARPAVGPATLAPVNGLAADQRVSPLVGARTLAPLGELWQGRPGCAMRMSSTEVNALLKQCVDTPSRMGKPASVATGPARPCTYVIEDTDQGEHAVLVREMEFTQGGLGWRVWCSALVLSRWIATHQDFVRGKSVLELGCGVGLPGLLAAKLGARSVSLTDFLPALMRTVDGSIGDNELCAVASAFLLDWSVADHEEETKPDWPTLPPTAQFDSILGADIMYEPEHPTMVMQILRQRLAPGGRACIVSVVRDSELLVTGGHIETFIRLAVASGFVGQLCLPASQTAPARHICFAEVPDCVIGVPPGCVMLRVFHATTAPSPEPTVRPDAAEPVRLGFDGGEPSDTANGDSSTDYASSDDGEMPYYDESDDELAVLPDEQPKPAAALLPVVSRAANRLLKRLAREAEDKLRLQQRQQNVDRAQRASLEKLVADLAELARGNSHAIETVPLVMRVDVPLWDAAALAQDAANLLRQFKSGKQWGPLHGDMWKTLSLRSHGGRIDSDCPGPSYENTAAWAARCAGVSGQNSFNPGCLPLNYSKNPGVNGYM